MILLNIFPIVQDYYKNLKKELNLFHFITTIFIVPIILTFIFYYLITYCEITKNNISVFSNLSSNLIIIVSIFIPLFLNMMIVIHSSIDRTLNSKDLLTFTSDEKKKNLYIKKKLEFIEHTNSTLGFSILIAISILIINLILGNNRYIFILNLFLLSLLLENTVITLLDMYSLIKLETNEKQPLI